MKIKPKIKAKNFKLESTSLKTFDLSKIKSGIVLYFYPKDSPPGCTTEGQDFRDNYKSFQKLNTEILGVSRDSIKSHENFKLKQSLSLIHI